MKVLFAMGSNQWSKNISDRYYDKFGETIEYKDVFYFKALLDEVRRDKTYNVIIIHEDLEQYKTKDIEQLDRKLFSYVDSITDEAQDADIIYVCSDRRTKEDQFIVRLYSIGIYNILLGDDRNVNPLCEMIKKPKTKREAKEYLNIDSSSINETGIMRDDEVAEDQMVSILNYYDKIKEQPEKYVETFDRISTQYSREQLKVIASWLPKDVQEVIYNEPKYKFLLLFDGGQQKVNTSTESKPIQDIKKIERARSRSFLSNVFKVDKPRRMQEIKDRKIDKINKAEESKKQEPEVNLEQEIIENNKKIEEARMQQELAERAKREAAEREQQVLAERAKREAAEREQQVLAERAKREQEEKIQLNDEIIVDNTLALNEELNNKLKIEAEARAKQEQEEKERKEAEELKQQQELTARLKEEAARRAKQEQEEKERKEEEELKQQQELNERLKEEAARRAKQEQEEKERKEAEELKKQQELNERLRQEEITKTEQLNETAPSFQNQNIINASVVTQAISEEQKRFKEEQEKLAMEQEKIRKVQAELEEEKRKLREEQERLAKEKNQVEVMPTVETRTTYEMATVTPVNYKKVVAFVGANKAGTTFMVNAVAQQLSTQKLLTSILDMTRDKSMYYIYNQSDKTLRKIAGECMQRLSSGEDTYMPISKYLKVYTTIPGGISDSRRGYKHKSVIETVKENSNVTIIDADFTTPIDYFENASEIYVVQDMDILKIQETTMFLREMKNRNMDMSKIRIIINKYVKNMLTPKKIIEGLSYYKDPEMTFIDTLLNNKVMYSVVPYNLNNYVKYIESLYKGTMSFKGYSADFIEAINEISNQIYSKNGMVKKNRGGLFG